ncbi:MAG: hypothetical protein GC159_24000 [Phycisphaera sp.]|nr:hypothetical protein [Phycisphaera sp.]
MFHPTYAILVGLSVAMLVLFPLTRHLRRREDRRRYWTLQGITLVGALIGAKLSVLLGDLGWPMRPVDDWWAVVVSGRSITGALILGFVAAETAKPWMGYTMPPNDRFATLLPFTLAIGRVGCLLTGCCRGAPWDGFCAIRYADGVPRHPAQAYEILFQVAIGCAFIVMLRRGVLFGRLFALYLVAYGVFRFATEFIRETPKLFGGFSGYQLLCVVMLLLGGGFLLRRTLRPPRAWDAYRPGAAAIVEGGCDV